MLEIWYGSDVEKYLKERHDLNYEDVMDNNLYQYVHYGMVKYIVDHLGNVHNYTLEKERKDDVELSLELLKRIKKDCEENIKKLKNKGV